MAKLPDKLRAAQTVEIKQRTPGVEGLKTAPSMFLADQNRLYDAEKKLEKALQKKIPIKELHEVPGRRRRLTPDAYVELKTNLETNPLISPISVIAREGGGYEVVAGHNRLAVYRELGRQEIEAIVLDFPHDEVGDLAFYSNLINSELTDFEKFLGFKSIQGRTGMEQQELAKRSGVSKGQISRVMSFGYLPEQVIEIIKLAPDCLGATSAQKLKVAGSKVSIERLIEALEMRIENKMTEAQAVAWAVKQKGGSKSKSKSVDTPVMVNGKMIGKITRTNGAVIVSLNDQEKMEDLLGLLEKWVDKLR